MYETIAANSQCNGDAYSESSVPLTLELCTTVKVLFITEEI